MKFLISTAMAAALAVTLPACDRQAADGNAAGGGAAAEAASLAALNGTWTADLATLKFGGKPDEVLVKDGTYNCATCIPPLTMPADGQLHPVADRPYYDHASVRIVDDRTIEIKRQKGGKDVSSMVHQVSADGKTSTYRYVDMTTPGQKIEGSTTATRVGEPVAGAHAVSGQWQADKVADYTKEALDLTFQINGDSVTSTFQGQTYTATLGGPAVAIQGDTGGTTVKVERAGNGLKETFMRGGKEVGIATATPSADGRSISYNANDPRDGSTTSFTANKKS